LEKQKPGFCQLVRFTSFYSYCFFSALSFFIPFSFFLYIVSMKPTAPSIQKSKGARVVISKKLTLSGDSTAVDDKLFKENMKRYEQDLTILSKKIADCQGDNTPVPGLVLPTQPESLFVNNLRNSVDKGNSGNENTLRLNMLERIMDKLADLDRVILKKTDLGTTTARARRKSKDGSDLFSMPTHLLLVDRLLDVFTVSQRLQIIEKQRGASSSSDGSSSSSSKDIAKKNSEIEKLNKQLQEAEVAKNKYETFATEKDAELEAFKREHHGCSTSKGKSTDKGGDMSKLTVIGDGKAVVSVEVNGNQSNEITELKGLLAKSEQQVRDMEERIEIMAASEQSTLNGIVSLTFALSNSQDVPTPEKLSLQFLVSFSHSLNNK
jgi:hypothetical protein